VRRAPDEGGRRARPRTRRGGCERGEVVPGASTLRMQQGGGRCGDFGQCAGRADSAVRARGGGAPLTRRRRRMHLVAQCLWGGAECVDRGRRRRLFCAACASIWASARARGQRRNPSGRGGARSRVRGSAPPLLLRRPRLWLMHLARQQCVCVARACGAARVADRESSAATWDQRAFMWCRDERGREMFACRSALVCRDSCVIVTV
jgi:hypothetical protein